jgi:hypothetical protein
MKGFVAALLVVPAVFGAEKAEGFHLLISLFDQGW